MASDSNLTHNLRVKDSDVWLGSWFSQLQHLVEYTCIHAALLPIARYSVPSGHFDDSVSVVLDDRWISRVETLGLLKAEPYGLPSSRIVPTSSHAAWAKHVVSLLPTLLVVNGGVANTVTNGVPDIMVVVDADGVCCLCIGGMSLFWLIHASKLVLKPPKSKRRGLSDSSRRSKSLVGIVALSTILAKQCANMLPALSLITDATFLEACLKCWIETRYKKFAHYIKGALQANSSELDNIFATKLGGHPLMSDLQRRLQHSLTTRIFVDVTWFVSRFDICTALLALDVSLESTAQIVMHLKAIASTSPAQSTL